MKLQYTYAKEGFAGKMYLQYSFFIMIVFQKIQVSRVR